MLIRNKRVRAAGRSVPGLEGAYRVALGAWLRARGRARIDYAGASLYVRATSKEIVHLRVRPVAKEPWTVEWIEANVRKGDVLYDIGANVGDYALIAASVASGVTVVALEPIAANYASLCDNVQLNRLGGSIVPLPVALGAASGVARLTADSADAGATARAAGAGDAGAQPALAVTLDELVERFALPPPTLIKLDVDGAEAGVLAGAAATLRRPELRSLVIEVEEDRTDDVLRLTEAAGLVVQQRIADRYGEPLPGVWYGIFGRAG